MENDYNLFKNFYDNLYKNILDEYYKDIDNSLHYNEIRKYLNFIILGIIPAIGMFLILFKRIYLIFIIVFIIFYLFAIYKYTMINYKDQKKKYINKIKYNILDDMITLISGKDTSSILPNSRISLDSFNRCDFFNLEKLFYDGKNYIQTSINNNSVVIGDIELYILQNKYKEEYFYQGDKMFLKSYISFNKKDIFNGIYIGAFSTKKNDSAIQIIPHSFKKNLSNKINNYYKFYDKEIFLENPEFTKKYDVYTNDEIKSRILLNLSMMENINSLDNIIDNNKYIFFKNDSRFSVFIEGYTIEEMLNKNIDSDRNDEVKNIYNLYIEIMKLFQIIQILNQ